MAKDTLNLPEFRTCLEDNEVSIEGILERHDIDRGTNWFRIHFNSVKARAIKNDIIQNVDPKLAQAICDYLRDHEMITKY